MKTTKPLLVAAALTLPLAAFAEGDSPWLPIPQQWSLTASVTDQSAKDAFIGKDTVPLTAITGGAASKFRQTTTGLRLDYGFSDALAFDATLAYAKVKAGAADSDSGLADSVVGLRWRVLDELESPGLPTLTLRAAAIIKGSYEPGRLAALGNGENGVELSVLLGKQITPDFAVWAQAGVQDRSGRVPNAMIYELGARYRFAPGWGATIGYSGKDYGGNLDIGGPGFTPARFQEVRAERRLAKFGLGYALAANQGVALNYSMVVGSGRNAVKDDNVIGLSYTIGF